MPHISGTERQVLNTSSPSPFRQAFASLVKWGSADVGACKTAQLRSLRMPLGSFCTAVFRSETKHPQPRKRFPKISAKRPRKWGARLAFSPSFASYPRSIAVSDGRIRRISERQITSISAIPRIHCGGEHVEVRLQRVGPRRRATVLAPRQLLEEAFPAPPSIAPSLRHHALIMHSLLVGSQ